MNQDWLEKHASTTLQVCIDQIENQTGRIRNFENAAKIELSNKQHFILQQIAKKQYQYEQLDKNVPSIIVWRML